MIRSTTMFPCAGSIGIDIIVLGALALVFAVYLCTRTKAIPKGLRLPPGPPGKPLIGNATDMPTHHEWETFSRWAKEYGDLVYLEILGQPMVVINSMEVAYDLFEKGSSIYSDRCDFPMLNDLMGLTWDMAFMPYGDVWRRHRKLFHQKFHPTAATEWHPIQVRWTRDLLRRLHKSPEDFEEHLHHTAGGIIMEVVYGIKVAPKDDHYIQMAERALSGMTVAGNPGTFLVDMLPILRYVPEWMPGAGFRKKARFWRQAIDDMSATPFMAVKNALVAGTAAPSFTATFLEDVAQNGNTALAEEDDIRGAGSAAYAAGYDTTSSILHTFMLGVAINTDAQKKAQAELDSVIGPYRLPEFGDRDSLPYMNAIVKEVLRWQPIVPLAIAHRVMQDDVYGNYFIPKGTTIIGNSWQMLHSEAYGPDTEKFKPERFLVPGAKDPNPAFGYGRRTCPGRYLADNSLFIVAASILKVFDITPPRDVNGQEIPVKAAFTSGFTSRPETFKCSIKPRSRLQETLIME